MTPLPLSLSNNPLLSSWVAFPRLGAIAIAPGKVEIGQGILTALAQIAADELDVDIAHIEMIPPTTAHSPNEGLTAGSQSIQHSGTALRQVCAEIRRIFLAAAADRLGVAADVLEIRDGVIAGPGNVTTSYWELAPDVSLDRKADGKAQPKPAALRQCAGRSLSRIDIPDKVFARPRFIHDSAPAGTLHGRVLRPTLAGARLLTLDQTAAQAVPGVVTIHRDGGFCGVVAESEHAAEAAIAALRAGATWSEGIVLPDQDDLPSFLRSEPVETTRVDERSPDSQSPVVRRIEAQYFRPYIAHAPIAPSCAMARFEGTKLEIRTHSQGIYPLRNAVAGALGLEKEDVVVTHMEGAGCYGHNAADDVAFDAVLLARAVTGRMVMVQWSREDEMTQPPFGPAMAITIAADLDDKGDVLNWHHAIWSNGHVGRPGLSPKPAFRATSEWATPQPLMVSVNPPFAGGGGAERNAVPLYDFPGWKIESHRLLTMPLRTSALRTLGAHANVFAIESMIDEIACLKSEDPLSFRLRHLRDDRARDVLAAVARMAQWKPERRDGIGHGLAFARYKNAGAWCAVVAEVDCTADIRVRRLTIAVDVGEVINPDGVINQIEGGAIQATSWTLKEQLRFDRSRITSTSWTDYPILSFSETPIVEVELMQRPDKPTQGAGEAAHGPVSAAIANAVYDCLGLRLRELPITRDKIIAAL
ncbi:MAG: molybdopterin-dependent oxidoreductase [Alphaproteobacteria bacterium]|nr:molybdopterin-dependent oxidoreductase [Alphaproteobacteria bacterium]